MKYFLYTILDIFSRKTVGWSLHESESEKHSRRLIRETCTRNRIDPKTPIGKTILGASNQFTATICSLTNNQPSTVCDSAGVKAAIAALPAK